MKTHLSAAFRARLCAIALPLCVLLAGSVEMGHASPLTRVREIRQLHAEEAAGARALRLRGTVTAVSGWKNSFFLQDSSAGISVDRTDSADVHAGDEVEVTGVTGPGMFAPVAVAHHVEVVGRGRLPQAKPTSYMDLAHGSEDSQRVEVRGVVRSVSVSESWGRQVLFLKLTVDAGTVTARVHEFSGGDFSRLVDAAVRVRGVCGTIFNDRRQLMGVRLFVPSLNDIQVEQPALSEPFALSALSLSRLFQFDSIEQLDHRIKVKATVTHHDLTLGKLYLQAGRDAAVAHIADTVPIAPGAIVEVVGFVARGQYPAELQDAILRKVGEQAPPVPQNVNPPDVIQKEGGFAFAPYSGRLVRMEGELIEKVLNAHGQIWLMREGDQIFRVSLDRGVDAWKLGDLNEHSKVRLTGICIVETDRNGQPHSFTVLPRSTEDIVLIERPWWNGKRLTWLIGSFLIAMLAMLVWVLQVRSALRRLGPELARSIEPGQPIAPRVAGSLCAILGAIVLCGWGFDIASLRSVLLGNAEMQPNTAFGLLIAGCAVWASARKTRLNRRIAICCAAVVLLTGALALTQYICHVDLGIDKLLFHSASSAGAAFPGRPAPMTAAVFVLAGCSLLLVAVRRCCAMKAQVLTFAGGIICLVNLIGSMYGVKDLFGAASPVGMAAPSAVGGIILCAGILLLQPRCGLMARFTSEAPGGLMARRLFPAAILVPVCLGWFRWQGQMYGLYDAAFGTALYTGCNIIVLTFLIWTSAGVLNRAHLQQALADARTRESEASLRQLADAMPQMVWAAKPDGSFDYFNQRWHDYTGMTPTQKLNRAWLSALHPDDYKSVRDRWVQSYTNGASYQIEARIKRASDGAYRWHLGRAVPIRRANGEITHWFGTCTDIEDYKQAEAAIRMLNEDLENRVQRRTSELQRANKELVTTRAHLQGILDSATQVAIVSTDTTGVIRLFNSGAERMLQYKAGELVGIKTAEIFHDPSEVVTRTESLSLELGRPITGVEVFGDPFGESGSQSREWTYVRKDGSTLDASLAITAIRDSEGSVEGFLGVAIDITSRKSLERALRLNNERLAEQTRKAEEANSAKSEFLASMSHEIRTPMNSILGMADLLWDTELSPEQRQYVEVFRRAGSNLLTLINDILDLSKIEAGHFELENVEFDLEEMIDETMTLIGPKARGKSIDLLSRLSPGLNTSVIGDPTRTRQVLINLLGNAVKFTDAGEVVLTASNDESGFPCHVTFSVSDTGIGIPHDKLETIFGDFTQADSSTTRKYGGTGLGLAISRRIVERMGGRLTVTSSPGAGSTFRFTIPLEPVNGRKPGLPAEVSDLHGKRMLLVDDSATNRLILREALHSWGVQTHECATPAAALEALAVHSYALVILDNRMPGMNGLELAAQIALHTDVPIVMLTSDTSPGDLTRRNQLRLAGYAVKPVRRSELLRLLCSALKAPDAPTLHGSSIPIVTAENSAASRPLRILVAEDAPDNRLLVEVYLKNSPHVLSFVENGEAAVEAFMNGGPFDLVLMDMQMPVMDGLDATRAIRAVERERGLTPVPIIALTANARREDIERSRAAGCSVHLSKPISKQKLVSAIEEYGSLLQPEPPASEDTSFLIPDGLEDLVQEYLEGLKSEVVEMISLLAASDYERLRILGHNMKGSGASYGFPELTRFGGELETAAKRADETAVAAQIADIGNYLSRVCQQVPALEIDK